MHHQYMNVSGSLSTSSSVLKNCRWHKFQGLFGNHLWVDNHIDAFFVFRIRKLFFVWLLNSSIYLINRCWRDFKVFVEPTIYEPIIMLIRDDTIKTRKFLFIWMVIVSVYMINVCCHELLGFCGANQVIYEPKITLIRRDLPQCFKIYYFYCKNVDGRHKKSCFSVIYFF